MIVFVRNLCVLCVLCVLFCANVLLAQDNQRIHVSNTDPRWGETIIVHYSAPDSASFTKLGSPDTLYCAVIASGAGPEHATVQKMHQLDATTFEAKFTVPDSTCSLRIEACTPIERVPDGVILFGCRSANWKPTPGYSFIRAENIDSALAQDLAMYPKHYTGYVEACDRELELQRTGEIKISNKSFGECVSSLITQINSKPDTTPAWYLSLAALYLRNGQDSHAYMTLNKASETLGYDPVFNNVIFWKDFFAPVMNNAGGVAFDPVPARIIAPLVERNPNSVMAAGWIRHCALDTMLPSASFEKVAERWSSSHDVDVLLSVSLAYGYDKGPLHNPDSAMIWCNRAEDNWRTHDGFYSGENISSSINRIEDILPEKIHILAELGKIDEAANVAAAGLQMAQEQYGKQKIAVAIAKAYLYDGRLDDAKRAYGVALALSTRSDISGLKILYNKCKEGNETQQEFAKNLIAKYGGNAGLPVVPNFAFTTLDGMKGTLDGLRGKVVVLDCWFTMCAGSATEKQSLNHLVDSYNGDPNVVFLSIALDDQNTLDNYLKRTESKFKIVPNGHDICAKLGVAGYPTHIIIGRDGTTLGFELGGSDKEGDLMRPKIEQALAVKTSGDEAGFSSAAPHIFR